MRLYYSTVPTSFKLSPPDQPKTASYRPVLLYKLSTVLQYRVVKPSLMHLIQCRNCNPGGLSKYVRSMCSGNASEWLAGSIGLSTEMTSYSLRFVCVHSKNICSITPALDISLLAWTRSQAIPTPSIWLLAVCKYGGGRSGRSGHMRLCQIDRG